MPRTILLALRRDTAANWTAANPVLASGEPGYETDTGKLKIGDGATAWGALGYFLGSGVTSLDSLAGAVTLTAGANITITDNTPSAGHITIAAQAGPSGLVNIYDTTLGADTASIDTLATLATTYSALLVAGYMRVTNAGQDVGVAVTVNNDTAAHYDGESWFASNATTTASNQRGNTSWGLDAQGTNASDSYAAAWQIWLPNYGGTTFWKTGTYFASVPYAPVGNEVALTYGLGWQGTAAINRIKVAATGGGSLKAGSRLTIYGLP